MTPIVICLKDGRLPEDKGLLSACGNHSKARALVHKVVCAGYY